MDQILDFASNFTYTKYIIAFFVLLAVTIIIQVILGRREKKYSNIRNSQGLTGEQAAQIILEANGIDDVEISVASGWHSNYYSPTKRMIVLSPEVYAGKSIYAVGIAAHEAGHAVQFNRRYLPIMIDKVIAPVASFGSSYAFVPIIVGLLISIYASTHAQIGYYVALAGVFLFLFAVLHSLLSLPVEFNASKRARKSLADTLSMEAADIRGVRKVLNACALTYVAGLANAVLSLLRMLSLVAGSRRK